MHTATQYSVAGSRSPTVKDGRVPEPVGELIVWTGVVDAPVGKPEQSPY